MYFLFRIVFFFSLLATSSHSFWTIEYYQKFFNVKTNDVVERIKRSIVPHGRENYLISHIRPNPDLYGPFWICVTLIFSIAISGNLAGYLQTADSSKYHWRYEFHIVSYAATCIFLYAWLLPLILWGALKWTYSTRNTEEGLIEVRYYLFILYKKHNVINCKRIVFILDLYNTWSIRTLMPLWLFFGHLYSSSFSLYNSNRMVTMEFNRSGNSFIRRSAIEINVTCNSRYHI